jgi:predicted nucleotidyltransferase
VDRDRVKGFIFGSWVDGSNRPYSDVDVGLDGGEPIAVEVRLAIEEELEQSNLPFIVEVVDFQQVSEQFKQVALQKTMPLN